MTAWSLGWVQQPRVMKVLDQKTGNIVASSTASNSFPATLASVGRSIEKIFLQRFILRELPTKDMVMAMYLPSSVLLTLS
jgi:hypothetical protein